MVGTSVTVGHNLSIDNTSRVSVATPELAATGYQQDPGRGRAIAERRYRVIPRWTRLSLKQSPY
jgi:hypothetical protein